MPKIKKNNDLSMNMALADIKSAEAILKDSSNTRIPKYMKGLCAYHLQQAAEKLIKIQIYSTGIPVNNSKMYKHALIALLQYAQSLGISINIPKYILSNAKTITDWESLGRYDIHVVVRTDTLNKCLRILNEWYDDLYKDGYR